MITSKHFIKLVGFIFVMIVVVVIVTCKTDVKGKLLDMTYVYDESTIYWPTAKGFELKKLAWEVGEAGYWYASNEYSASEHGGTHADAPIHFAENGRTMDQIPLEEWIGQRLRSMWRTGVKKRGIIFYLWMISPIGRRCTDRYQVALG